MILLVVTDIKLGYQIGDIFIYIQFINWLINPWSKFKLNVKGNTFAYHLAVYQMLTLIFWFLRAQGQGLRTPQTVMFLNEIMLIV